MNSDRTCRRLLVFRHLVGFFGHTNGLRGAVANLTNNETLAGGHLYCDRCPEGVICRDAGEEFEGLQLVPGRWQVYDFFVEHPKELAVVGLERCLTKNGESWRWPVVLSWAGWCACGLWCWPVVFSWAY